MVINTDHFSPLKNKKNLIIISCLGIVILLALIIGPIVYFRHIRDQGPLNDDKSPNGNGSSKAVLPKKAEILKEIQAYNLELKEYTTGNSQITNDKFDDLQSKYISLRGKSTSLHSDKDVKDLLENASKKLISLSSDLGIPRHNPLFNILIPRNKPEELKSELTNLLSILTDDRIKVSFPSKPKLTGEEAKTFFDESIEMARREIEHRIFRQEPLSSLQNEITKLKQKIASEIGNSEVLSSAKEALFYYSLNFINRTRNALFDQLKSNVKNHIYKCLEGERPKSDLTDFSKFKGDENYLLYFLSFISDPGVYTTDTLREIVCLKVVEEIYKEIVESPSFDQIIKSFKAIQLVKNVVPFSYFNHPNNYSFLDNNDEMARDFFNLFTLAGSKGFKENPTQEMFSEYKDWIGLMKEKELQDFHEFAKGYESFLKKYHFKIEPETSETFHRVEHYSSHTAD